MSEFGRIGKLIDKIPYWWLDGRAMVLNDGTIGYAYELTPRDISTSTDDDINALAEASRVALRSLPEGSMCQFLLIQEPIVDWENYEKALTPKNPILAQLRAENRKLLEAMRFRGRRLYCFVSVPQILGKIDHSSSGTDIFSRIVRFIFSDKLPSEITQESHREACEYVSAISEGFASALAKPPLELLPKPLSGRELLHPIHTMLNFTDASNSTASWDKILHSPSAIIDGLSLRQHLISGGISVSPQHLFVGDRKVTANVLTMAGPLEVTVAGAGVFLSELDCSRYAVSFVLRAGDQRTRYRKLEAVWKREHAKANSGPAGNIAAATKEKNLKLAMELMTQQGYSMYDATLSVFFVAPDITKSDEATRAIVRAADKQSTIRLISPDMKHFQSWTGMFPFNGHKAAHQVSLLTPSAADIMPIYGSYTGTRKPHIVFGTKPNFNSLQNLSGDAYGANPTDPGRSSWNDVIFGATGKGKSFFALSLITQCYLPTGAPLMVVDVGGGKDGSYWRLCNMMGGTYIQIDPSGRNAWNPLIPKERLYFDEDAKQIASNPNEDFLQRLIALTTTLVTEKNGEFSVLDQACLRKALLRCYEKSSKPNIRLLYEVLGQAEGVTNEDKDIWRLLYRRLGASLDSAIGRIFGGENSLVADDERPMVVYDMMGIDALGHRGTALLLMVSNAIADMRSRRKRSGIGRIIYDEVWSLLKNQIAADIITADYRLSRKYGIGVTSITQSLVDFFEVPGARTIIRNSSAIWALAQSADDAKKVGDACAFNSAEVSALINCGSVKGRYSEIFHKDFSAPGNPSRVLRLYPSPYAYWISTTDSGDKELEARVRAETHYEGPQLLQELARLYPHGASQARAKLEATV